MKTGHLTLTSEHICPFGLPVRVASASAPISSSASNNGMDFIVTSIGAVLKYNPIVPSASIDVCIDERSPIVPFTPLPFSYDTPA